MALAAVAEGRPEEEADGRFLGRRRNGDGSQEQGWQGRNCRAKDKVDKIRATGSYQRVLGEEEECAGL